MKPIDNISQVRQALKVKIRTHINEPEGMVPTLSARCPNGCAWGFLLKRPVVLEADMEDGGAYEAAHLAVQTFGDLRKLVYLHSLKVDEKDRANGIGSELLRRFMKRAHEYAAVVVLLANPDDIKHYDQLIQFYKHRGFKQPYPDKHPSFMYCRRQRWK